MAQVKCKTCGRWFYDYEMVRSNTGQWYCKKHYVRIRNQHTLHEATKHVVKRIRAKQRSGEVYFRKKKCYLCDWPFDQKEMVDYPGGISVCGGCACIIENEKRKKALAKEHGLTCRLPKEESLYDMLKRYFS